MGDEERVRHRIHGGPWLVRQLVRVAALRTPLEHSTGRQVRHFCVLGARRYCLVRLCGSIGGPLSKSTQFQKCLMESSSKKPPLFGGGFFEVALQLSFWGSVVMPTVGHTSLFASGIKGKQSLSVEAVALRLTPVYPCVTSFKI